MKITKTIFAHCLNILGLTVAFAAFIIIIMQVNYDLNYDKSYKEYEKIYRFEHSFMQPEGSSMRSCNTYRALIEQLAEACPTEIESLAELSKMGDDTFFFKRLNNSNSPTIKVSRETATASLIDMIGLEITLGSVEKFTEPGNIIISESTANAYFKNENPIGKAIHGDDDKEHTIIAVHKDFPRNSSFKNGVLMELGDKNKGNFSNFNYSTLIKLRDEKDIQTILDRASQKVVDYFGQMNPSIPKDTLFNEFRKGIFLTPLTEAHFSKNIQYDWAEKANKSTLYTLLSISILIILIAIINFINFSIASIPLIIKDINTRKILGSTNTQIRMRKIMEACLISFISFALALGLLYILSDTAFNSYFSAPIELSTNIPILVFTLAIALLTGIVAGLYPAIYSSSFAPALALKGTFSLSPKGRALRSGLVIFQYVISFVLIIVALFMNIQSRYMKNYNMGYETKNILTVPLSESLSSDPESFSSAIKKNPQIEDITYASGMLISNGKMNWGRTYKGEDLIFDCFPVASNFIDFFGMEILEGRDFNKSDELKKNGSFIFNKKAVDTYDIEVGAQIDGHSENGDQVVGVVNDFNFMPLQYGINPISLYVFGSEPWHRLKLCYIKLSPSADVKECISYIVSTMKEMNPAYEIEGSHINFMDERIGQLYAKEDALTKLILAFCILSVLLSIIGILCLIYFETQFKRKEIGLRRVYGSSITEILKMLNLTYIKMLTISFLVAIPASIFIIKLWLKNFTYQSPIPVWIFIAAYILLFIISVLVITLRSLQAAHANPVDSLKGELN